jgi:flavin-dependent dehydrogenase
MGHVVVIGGGPGGSTAASMLARAGHRVTLFERERFPRAHIGESLLPATVPILEALGVRDAVEAAGCLKKYGATMVWGRDPAPWSWYFRETNVRYPHAYQVFRPQFDQILLEASRSAGVQVQEGVRVERVCFDGERAVGVRTADGIETTADFVVDASGQAAMLGHELGIRRWDDDFRNMAVFGYFEGAHRLDAPDETNILVEAYGEGWCWVIPLHVGVTSVGVVVDAPTARARLRGDALRPFLDGELAKTAQARRLLADARLVDGPHTLRDWSYTSARTVGDGWILVGDAACFVDPLFSSGVHLAMSAGMLASAYVDCALGPDAELVAAAAPLYQELYYAQYYRFHEMAKLFYASNATVEGYFWEARRILGEALTGSEDDRTAFIRAVAGQSPLGYERAVLAQGNLPAGLEGAIASVEADLAARRDHVQGLGPALLDEVARRAPGVAVGRDAVLDGGRFVWGETLSTPNRSERVPVSPLVATVVRALDGRRLAEVLDDLSGGDDARRAALAAHLPPLIGTLYADGAVELSPPGATPGGAPGHDG